MIRSHTQLKSSHKNLSPEPCSDPEEPELPVPMVLDHEYSATSTVCVDREHYSAIQKETFVEFEAM